MTWVDWAGRVALIILGLNVLAVLVLWLAALRRERRYRRWLRTIPDAERLDRPQPQHIRVTAKQGRIDWPLDLPPARNGDSITIEHQEDESGPS